MDVVLMLPSTGDSQAEQWVAAGRKACAIDLTSRLLRAAKIQRVIALVAEEGDRDELKSLGVKVYMSGEEPFQFGSALAKIIEQESISSLAYFGGASAPLLETQSIELLIERVLAVSDPFGIANNLHSTDWIVLNDASMIGAHSHRLPADNPLGWVLSREAGVRVESMEPSAATRLDIDTPTDLFMAWKHPSVGPALEAFLQGLPDEVQSKLTAIREIMRVPASTLTVIGRASAHVWQRLVEQTQIWVRLYVEERGMVASQRLARGEVRSLVGQFLEKDGPVGFVHRLGGMTDAVLWDTRVWMGTKPQWPSDADRFAADLEWIDAIEESDIRELTKAIKSSEIPILAGGYGVVGGGLYALLESLAGT